MSFATKEFEGSIDIKSIGEDGSFSGYASVFNVRDRGGDVVAKGAFADTLKARPASKVRMFWSHDRDIPIGVWKSFTEDDHGLKAEGQLLLDVPRGLETYKHLKAGTVDSLSIGYRVTADEYDASLKARIIKGIELVEVSVVSLPMNESATITNVKAEGQEDTTMTATAENIAIDTKAADALTARIDELEAKLARPNLLSGANDNEKTDEEKSFGAYLRRGDAGLGAEERKALVVATDATAGFLAPTTFGDEILKSLRQFSPIRQYAKVITIAGRDVRYPRRIGSTAATWTDEIANRTESAPSYEQVTLTPYELATFVEVSRQLLEDNAYNLEGELASDLAESFAIAEGTAFVSGTGTGQPKGILAATGITQIVSGAAATLGTAPGDLLIDAFSKIATIHAQNGAWGMNRNTLAAVRKIKDTTGAYLWQPSLRDGAPSTLLGRPVIEMVDFPDIAAGTFPIVFGDWSGYRIVDRTDFSILSDPYTRAKNGINVFHARKRVGGDVTNPDRFVKVKISAT